MRAGGDIYLAQSTFGSFILSMAAPGGEEQRRRERATPAQTARAAVTDSSAASCQGRPHPPPARVSPRVPGAARPGTRPAADQFAARADATRSHRRRLELAKPERPPSAGRIAFPSRTRPGSGHRAGLSPGGASSGVSGTGTSPPGAAAHPLSFFSRARCSAATPGRACSRCRATSVPCLDRARSSPSRSGRRAHAGVCACVCPGGCVRGSRCCRALRDRGG